MSKYCREVSILSHNESVHPFAATGKLSEDTPALHELRVGALLLDLAVVDDEDAVTHAHDLQLVRDHERRAADLGVRDGLHHCSLVCGVQCRRALVEDEDAGRPCQGTSDLKALRLSTRDERGVLPDGGLVALGQGHDEFVHVRSTRGVLDRPIGEDAAVRNVLCNGRIEEVRLLAHDGDVVAEVVDVHPAGFACVADGNGAGCRLVEALEERGDGGLAGP